MNKLFIASLLLILAFPVLAAEQVVIIVNSSNTQKLSKQDIKNIYTDKTIKWENGKPIQVYNLPAESKPREIFSQAILGMSGREAASQDANRKITNTLQNPASTKRERLVVSIVSKRPRAIGYAAISSIKGKAGIRIVHTLD
jgi:ABC-type phosphate transport system substrate-binding protein